MRFSQLFAWCVVGSLTITISGEFPLCAAEPGDAIPGIVFVGGPVVDGEHEGYPGAYHWRDGYVYPKGATNNAWERTHSAPRPGRNLFSLVPAAPDGKLTQLTFLKNGSVYDPEPSPDGKKVLFSLRKDDDDWYHLFEVNIDGTGLRQLTDGPFNDISGAYLPDGRIVFCSDRTGVLDEYHEERSEFLFRMQPDGSQIEQLTFVPGIYFEPTVLRNGLILCSFWDAFHISVPPFIKHETYLITLRPDGTEERHLFGAGEHKFYNRTRHSAIGFTRPGELPDGRILVQSELGPSIYDPNIGTDLAQALAPIFPGTASAQTGGTTHTMHLSPLGTRSTPYPLQDGRFLMSATLPGSRDFGLYVVEPETRAMRKIFDRPNLSEWDPVPVAIERPLPRQLPDKPRETASNTAKFVVVAGRHSDTPERNELNRRARFVRVLQAEYTELAVSSHTSLETRILGTAPILPDGSIAFEAPAETPLFLETLDARGHRLVLQAGYMAARAGEVKSCIGCHASQSEATANPTVQALNLPLTVIRRDSTDLSYRRNDPDEYRRQAVITQSPEYRAWLSSGNAEIRRRGLELLAYLPDEVTTADRHRFVELLTDSNAEVRRQAAHTLAITGSADQVPALLASLKDDDWQTRHYAAMALEAITGENLELAADFTRAEETWTKWWRDTGSVSEFVKRQAARGQKFADDFQRDAWLEMIGRFRWLGDDSRRVAEESRPALTTIVRNLLNVEQPPPSAVRAAGLLGDVAAVPLIAPWLIRGERSPVEEQIPDSIPALAREVRGTALAKEAALALGRIGGDEAVANLWSILEKAVPNRAPVASRHYQTGPRPEEYTYLRALIMAGARPKLEHVHLLVALLPSTFGEKPRFEDRSKPLESQRVWLPRILLERAGLRTPTLDIAARVLRGSADAADPLYAQLLKGCNLDRPYSEHGHPFPVLKQLETQQALQFLACLAVAAQEIPEAEVAATLKTDPARTDLESSARERIEAAVIFRKFGFSAATEKVLLAEISAPYAFREIWSIGKGRFDTYYRDKAYLLMALATHTRDLQSVAQFADYTKYLRDIRMGLALGLGFRGTPDGIPLLQQLAHDPIFTVHRDCEYATVLIRDHELYAGRDVPEIKLARRQPLRSEYPAPGAFKFAVRTPDPLEGPAKFSTSGSPEEQVLAVFKSAVDATQYASVGNTFARNAERMRIFDADRMVKLVDAPEAQKTPLTPALEAAVNAAVESPFPFAHFLAARFITSRQEARFIPALIKKLPACVESADTVGFYWIADALGRLRAQEALPVLAEFAAEKTYPKTYGSIGMAYGFAAARGVGLIADGMQKAEVTRLLESENVWLRAGVLDGLIARGDATEVAPYLRQLLAEAPNAFLEEEARYGMNVLEKAR